MSSSSQLQSSHSSESTRIVQVGVVAPSAPSTYVITMHMLSVNDVISYLYNSNTKKREVQNRKAKLRNSENSYNPCVIISCITVER